MGFVIRRHLPRAWAGWRDTFTRAAENPLKPPWRHLGDGESMITGDGMLKITSQIVNLDGRGPSYEWMPFTPNWGFEADIWYPVEGLDEQIFMIGFTNTWVDVSATFHNVVGIWLYHQLGGSDVIQYGEVPNMWSEAQNTRAWPPPGGGFYDRWVKVRVWVENDEWLRVWLDDVYVGSAMIAPDWRLGPGRRCMRFMNRAYCDTYVGTVDHYDRPPTVPPKTVWTEVHADDFNRTDGVAGNGWTQFGTDAGIVSNRYVHTGTNNNSVGLLRDMGDSHGRARIEAVIRSPSNKDCSLMLFGNSGATQALVANVFNNHVYLGRMSSSVNGTPSMVDFQDTGVTVADGDTIALSVYNEIMWFEVNGVVKLYAGNVHNVIPDSNQWAGLRVRRGEDTNSGGFDSVKLFTGIGV